MLNFCFTCFKSPPIWTEISQYIKGIIYGFEICPETERPHFQGYIELSRTRDKKWIMKNIKKMAVFERKGSQEEAINYCKKDNQFVEYGEWKSQGKRNDLNKLCHRLIKGDKIEHVMLEDPATYCRNYRAFDRIKEFDQNSRPYCHLVYIKGDYKQVCKWIRGIHKDIYYKNGDHWSGYDDNEIIVWKFSKFMWEEALDIEGDIPYKLKSGLNYKNCKSKICVLIDSKSPEDA